MKIKLTTLILFLITCNAFSQVTTSWDWARNVTSQFQDKGYEVALDSAGNVYVVGTFSGPSVTFDTITLVNPNWISGSATFCGFYAKYNAAGHIQWAKFSGSDCLIYSVSVDVDGSIYMAGEAENNTISFDTVTAVGNPANRSYFLTRLDNMGNCRWIKIGGQGLALQVRVDGKGKVYAGGYFDTPVFPVGALTLYSNAPPGHSYNQFWVASFDTSGNVLWASATNCNCKNWLTSLSVDPVGNVYVAGHFFTEGIQVDTIALTNNGFLDAFLYKFNNNGVVQWGRSVGGTNSETYVKTLAGNSGNVYFITQIASPFVTVDTITLVNNGGGDIVMAKYDPLGNLIWAKEFGGTGVEASEASAIDSSENIYIAGIYTSPVLNLGQQTLINPGTQASFIAKCDSSGNFIWATSTEPPGLSYFFGLAATPEYLCVIGKSVNDTIVHIGTDTFPVAGISDVIMAKLSWINVGLSEIKPANNTGIVYPNPSSGTCTVLLPAQMQNGTIEIYSAQGTLLYSENVNCNKKEICYGSLSPGLYYVKAYNRQFSYAAKMIVAGNK